MDNEKALSQCEQDREDFETDLPEDIDEMIYCHYEKEMIYKSECGHCSECD